MATENQIPALLARYKAMAVDYYVSIVTEVSLFKNICEPSNLLQIRLTYS